MDLASFNARVSDLPAGPGRESFVADLHAYVTKHAAYMERLKALEPGQQLPADPDRESFVADAQELVRRHRDYMTLVVAAAKAAKSSNSVGLFVAGPLGIAAVVGLLRRRAR